MQHKLLEIFCKVSVYVYSPRHFPLFTTGGLDHILTFGKLVIYGQCHVNTKTIPTLSSSERVDVSFKIKGRNIGKNNHQITFHLHLKKLMFSKSAEHWDHLKSFKYYWWLNSTHKISFSWFGCDQGIKIFRSSPK